MIGIDKIEASWIVCRFGCRRALYFGMDERDFKKHLRDLVHGHHDPEEHG